MPRAFLITHRRYNGTEEFEAPGRDYSPERVSRVVDYGGGQPTSDGASDCGSETSSECPEELYNLTKLAEVSLAAAAGTLIHPSKVMIHQRSSSPRWGRQTIERYTSDRNIENSSRSNIQNSNEKSSNDLNNVDEPPDDGQMSLRERTRLFFERIESEREILESRNDVENSEISKIRSSKNLSPGRCDGEDEEDDEEEVSRLSDVPSIDVSTDSRTTESSKIVETTILRKHSSSVSCSDGTKSDDSEDHECPDCGKKYSTSSNLARHRQTHRSLGDKKARRCPHCDKIYVSMPAFSMHVRTHNQGCKCHYCGKCFSRPWLLQGHIRTHTGEKPFKCTICNKAFADKSNLRAHVQTHSNTKPHVCGRCGKAFALKSYLYKHEESSCMRAHNRTVTEKREGSTDSCGTGHSSSAKVESSNSTNPTNPTIGRVATPPVTASPTSVIVPRPGAIIESRTSSPSALSTIIRHTKNHEANVDESSPLSKRQCREKDFSSSEIISTNNKDEIGNKATEFLSRMVIRTSVISPNPEHVSRLGGINGKKSIPFDFTDPTRASAFSRPTGISLNLAIA